MQYACKAPAFYSEEFNAAAYAILAELRSTQQEITVSTVKTIHLHVYSKFSV